MGQSALVSTYYANANGASLYNQTQYDANRTTGRNDVINNPNTYSLYTLSQIQALNVGTPLLQKTQRMAHSPSPSASAKAPTSSTSPHSP